MKKARWNVFLMVLTLLLNGIYLIWRIGFTMPVEKGWVSFCCYVILLVAEISGFFELAVMSYNMFGFEKGEVKKPQLDEKWYPDVDILIPTLNEPVSLLEKTVRACGRMEYPKKQKIHIFVCDDGERAEVREMAERLGVNYLARTVHDDAKAGNLNYAMTQSSSPLVAVFDADMMPKRRFLMETVPYFAPNLHHMHYQEKFGKSKKKEKRDSEMVGFVQTPQNFYYPDLFQYNLFAEDMIPNEQDYFYRVVQIAKNKSNSVIFGGSNALLSRRALEEIGGFVTGVLTEDFATGIELEKAGYRGIAVSKILASGMPPKTFTELLRQRKRWAKGCICSGRTTHFLRSKGLNICQKLNYLTAIAYWFGPLKKLIYIMAPLLFVFFGVVAVECRIEGVLLFWLPMYLCNSIYMGKISQGIRTTRWTDVYDMVLFPYLLPTVMTGGLNHKKQVFHVTEKGEQKKRSSEKKYMAIYLLGMVINVVAALRMLGQMMEIRSFSYLALIFWLCVNAYYFLMAAYVSWGRKLGDAYEIQKVEEKGTFISQEGQEEIVVKGIFTDKIWISFLKKKEYTEGELETDTFRIRLLEGSKLEDGDYSYPISYDKFSESEKNKYEAFLYDREPLLPQKLQKKTRMYGMCVYNLFSHLTDF